MTVARRRFVAAGAASLAGAAVPAWMWRHLHEIHPSVVYPGRAMGHALRDVAHQGAGNGAHDGAQVGGAPDDTRDVGIAIVGSGAAALCCAWTLARGGRDDWLVVEGPEARGNLAGGAFAAAGEQWSYPTGAHYLPMLSRESTHLHALLREVGAIERDDAVAPIYDERDLVHAPDERVLYRGRWYDGLVPTEALPPDEQAEHRRFFDLMARLRDTRGRDGKRAFAIPIVASSDDPAWRALDVLTFRAWLDREGFRSTTLRDYLDYACRDDYGASAAQVSAWAGLHYFASRGGRAANAREGAVLTWPDGLATLAARIERACGAGRADHRLAATAVAVREQGAQVAIDTIDAQGRRVRVRADAVVICTPLSIAVRLMPELDTAALRRELPQRSSWLIANFLLRAFPAEAPGVPLAWDNVVAGAPGLGWVVSTHQALRVARPERTVFTAYRAIADRTPDEARAWLDRAAADALLDAGTSDLRIAYGAHFAPLVERAEITVRGHAMAIPTPGYRTRPAIAALVAERGRVRFAHSDLSGYSVFEEAAWWGMEAAHGLL